jgi:hypothetical protein
MAIALKKEVQKKGSLLDSNSNESPMQTIITRQSPDLFIGLCGFAGCGMKTVNSVLSKVAKSWNYDVVHIRISDLMQDPLYFEKKVIEENDDLNKERHIRMQKLANGLRRHYKKKELLAEAAITYIKSEQKRSKSGSPKLSISDCLIAVTGLILQSGCVSLVWENTPHASAVCLMWRPNFCDRSAGLVTT